MRHYSPRRRRHELWTRHIEWVYGRSETFRCAKYAYSRRRRRHELWKRRIECGCTEGQRRFDAQNHTDTRHLVHTSEWPGAYYNSEWFREHRYANFQHRPCRFRIIITSIQNAYQRHPIANYKCYPQSACSVPSARPVPVDKPMIACTRVREPTVMVTGKAVKQLFIQYPNAARVAQISIHRIGFDVCIVTILVQ